MHKGDNIQKYLTDYIYRKEAEEMQKLDFEWFLDNYKNLFEQYGISYLAIKNQKVIGSFNSFAEGVEETLKNEPIGTFIIQKCDGTESAYTNYISSMNFM